MNYYLENSQEILKNKKMIDSIIDFSIEVENKLKNKISDIKKENSNDIKEQLIKNSNNEIFHSVSIEWYKININDVEKINSWLWNQYSSEIEEFWIIKSYKRALEMIIQNYLWKNKKITKEDILAINYYEFIEFYESRWEKLEDHNYRNHRVWMNYCFWYTPVDSLFKIDILVDYLLENIDKIENHLIRWIALHFLMVPIQPFWDWNWRLSRFLMNITFSNWWYKWCTIDKHDYRREFLSSYWLINEWKYDELLKVYIRFISFIFWYFQFKFNKKDLLKIK